jgi:transposase-like protein
MATKKRQQYTAEFKAKVVLESLQRDTTIEAVRAKYGVSNSMIHRWRAEFNQNLPLLFGDKRNPKAKAQAQGYPPGEAPDDLKRVMKKYGLTARRKKKRSVYPGKAAQIAPNLVRELAEDAASEVVFSDIFEIQLADGSKVRGCFALWKRTRQILALAFDYQM